MKDEDYKAMLELASEIHSWIEASKFIRAETGLSLREAGYLVERIVSQRPDSALAKGWREYQAIVSKQA